MLEILFSIVHVLASAECLWGTCMHGKQYDQHALYVNDMLCIECWYLELIECMSSSATVYHYSHCCGVVLGNECHYELLNVSAMFRVH